MVTVETMVGHTWLEIAHAEITRLSVDAIVLSENDPRLLASQPAAEQGVPAGQLTQNGGSAEAARARALSGTDLGLQARWVIAARVATREASGESLPSAITGSLKLAESLGARTVAFSYLATSDGSTSPYAQAENMLAAVRAYLVERRRSRLARVLFCAVQPLEEAALGHAMSGSWRDERAIKRRP